MFNLDLSRGAIGQEGRNNTKSSLRIKNVLPDLSSGFLTALVTLSYSASYAALMFSGALSIYLPAGLFAAMVSCIVVVTVVALKSSMHFAIAGPDSNATAILAAIIAALSSHARDRLGETAVLPTVLMTLSLSALITGLLLYLLGHFRQGRVVRFIPYPVVGGFLAGTGYLLLEGVCRVMTGHPPSEITVESIAAVPWVSYVPTLAVAAALLVLTRTVKHYLVLPGVLVGGFGLFYLCLFVAGLDMEMARDAGLLFRPLHIGSWTSPLAISASMVDWGGLLSSSFELVAMVMVVVITILLNATGLDLQRDHRFGTGEANKLHTITGIDFDRELRAAGMANLTSGVLGGMVGYLSISRSLLNLRAGARSRASGLSVGLFCLAAAFLLPTLMGYLPRPALTGLLLYLGVSMLIEWTVQTYRSLALLDYLLVIAILVLIAGRGFLHGVGFGVVVASLLFVISYSRLSPIKHFFTAEIHRSNVVRSPSDAAVLHRFGSKAACLHLQGYLFFGTASVVLDEVRERLPSLRCLLVDFHQVQGLDISAVNTFSKLFKLCNLTGTRLVLTGLSKAAEEILRKTSFRPNDETVRLLPDADRGMEWIEDHILEAECQGGDCEKRLLEDTLSDHFLAEELQRLRGYLDHLEVEEHVVIAAQGDSSDAMFFVERGRVSIILRGDGVEKRVRTYETGTIVGEMGFYSGARRSADIVADKKTTLLKLSKEQMKEMERRDPELAARLHRYVIWLLSLRLSAANEELLMLF